MNTPIRTTTPVDRPALGSAYAVALQTYLACPEETTLSEAYELGRTALTDGLGPLDLVVVHEAAVEQASIAPDRHLRTRATAFLMEALSPFEMTYRRFLEANVALRGINEALESESRRTARQIHDGAGQILFSLQLALTELKVSPPERWPEHLASALRLADHLDQQLRSLSRDMYPVALDDLGINAAVQHLLNGVSKRSQLAVSFHSSVPDRLPPGVAVCLYRAIQEAVTNVVRHAHATTLDVTLDGDSLGIVCSVRDNGCGLSPGSGPVTGLGLLGIRERVKGLHGEVEIASAPEEGTRLIISIPLRITERSNGYQGPDC